MSPGAERSALQCCSLGRLVVAISASISGAASWAGLGLQWTLSYDWPDRENEQHCSVARARFTHTFIASGMTCFVLVFVSFMVSETQAASQHPDTTISTLLLRMALVV